MSSILAVCFKQVKHWRMYIRAYAQVKWETNSVLCFVFTSSTLRLTPSREERKKITTCYQRTSISGSKADQICIELRLPSGAVWHAPSVTHQTGLLTATVVLCSGAMRGHHKLYSNSRARPSTLLLPHLEF